MATLVWAGLPRWALIVIMVVSGVVALYALLVIGACQAELRRIGEQRRQGSGGGP